MNTKTVYMPHIPYDARFFYVFEGAGRIEADGKIYEMKKNSALIINSAVKYHLMTPKHFVSYIAVNFDYTYLNSSIENPVPPDAERVFNKKNVIEAVSFEDMQSFDRVAFIEDLFGIEKKIISVEYEYSRRMIMYRKVISNIFSEILIYCARKIKTQTPLENRCGIENILNYIYENCRYPLTNRDIAAVFGMNANYISDIVKVHTGMPLHRYLMHMRIAHATVLLDEGVLNIGEIAESCGFGDIYHFSAYFKRIMKMSPTSYRRR